MATVYTLDEVAAELKATYAHVWRLVKARKLAARSIGTGRKRIWRVTAEELQRFLSGSEPVAVPERRGGRLPAVGDYV